MRVRHLFNGWRLCIVPYLDSWFVSLIDSDANQESIRRYTSKEDALQGIAIWMEILSDDSELPTHDLDIEEEVQQLLRELLARRVPGEETPPFREAQRSLDDQRLREWFEREMG